MAGLKKGHDLTPLKERLGLYFLLLTLQVCLYRLLGQEKFSPAPLITSFFYLGISYFLLSEQLKGQFLKDYFIEKSSKKKSKHKELLIHGELIESDLEEDDKEQRFLRVAGFSNKMKRRILLLVYLATFIVGRHLVNTMTSNSSTLDHLLPLGLGTLALLSTTYGQLLALPLLSLLIGTLSLPSEINFNPNELMILSLALYIGFASLRIIISLPEHLNGKSDKSKYKFFSEVKGPILHLILCLWLINAIIPKKSERKGPSPSEKINKALGKAFKSPSKEIHQLRSKINHTDQAPLRMGDLPLTLPSLSFQEALNQMGQQLDFYKDLFNSNFFKDLSLKEMEKNYLINTHKEISNNYRDLQEQLFNKKELSAKDIEAAFDFFKKLQNLQDEIKDLNVDNNPAFFNDITPPEAAFKGAFNKAMKAELAPYEDIFNKENLKEKAPDLNLDFLKDDKKARLQNFDKFKEKLEMAQASKRDISDIIREKEDNEENLIDPDLLNKALDHVKTLFFLFLGFAILKFLVELFSKEKILKTSSKEAKALKRKFLMKFNYRSNEEEICDRYNKFLEATKNIYFEEQEEPPPPKILEVYLQKNSQHNQRALNFFTEMFSRSFYGGQEFTNKALSKYRKAYKSLIKSL